MLRKLVGILAFIAIIGNYANATVSYIGVTGITGTATDVAAAIAILNAQGSTTGGTIYLPSDRMVITATIQLNAGQVLQGTGASTLAAGPLFTGDVIKIVGNGVKITNLTIDRSVVDTTVATGWGDGIDLNGMGAIVLEDVSITCQRVGIKSSVTTNPGSFVFKDGFVGFCTQGFIDLSNVQIALFTMRGVSFLDSGGDGIKLKVNHASNPVGGISDPIIRDCIITNVNGTGLSVVADGSFMSNNLTISNLTISSVEGHGIDLYGNNVDISGSRITGAGSSVTMPSSIYNQGNPWPVNQSSRVADKYGIKLNPGCRHITLEDNQIGWNSSDGIHFEGGSATGANSITICNNLIYSNSRYSSTAYRAAIGFSSVGTFSHLLITGNRAYNDTDLDSTNLWQEYGFYNPTPTNITYLIMSNNDFADAGHTAGISGAPASYIGSSMNYTN